MRMLAALILGLAWSSAPTLAQRADEPRTETVVRGLVNPWGMAFLPDGRALVTERPGRLKIVNIRTNTISPPIPGLPPIAAQGQGGLLGLALDPEFASNRYVYLCFAEARDGGVGSSVFRGNWRPTSRRSKKAP